MTPTTGRPSRQSAIRVPKLGKAGRELAGPVDGVEDPHPFSSGTFCSVLLSYDPVPRQLPFDDAAQRRLHRAVHGSDGGRPVGLDLDLGLA